MKIVQLTKFTNETLIDEIVVDNCDLHIIKTGLAKYQITFADKTEKYTIDLWTSLKGIIETPVACKSRYLIEIKYDNNNNLKEFKCLKCNVHIEHMNRGHYWVKITYKNHNYITINFITRGYLKTKLSKNES